MGGSREAFFVREYEDKDYDQVVSILRGGVLETWTYTWRRTLDVRVNQVTPVLRVIVLAISLQLCGCIVSLCLLLAFEAALLLLIYWKNGLRFVWLTMRQDMSDVSLSSWTKGTNKFFVAVPRRDPDRVLGCVSFYHEADGVARLRRFSVSPDSRLRGVGTSLALKVRDTAIDLGYPCLIVETTNVRPAALHVYNKIGLKATIQRPDLTCSGLVNLSLLHGIYEVRCTTRLPN